MFATSSSHTHLMSHSWNALTSGGPPSAPRSVFPRHASCSPTPAAETPTTNVFLRKIHVPYYLGCWQTGKSEPSKPRDSAGACSGGKLVVSRAGEAYDARVRGPNREFGLTAIQNVASCGVLFGSGLRHGKDHYGLCLSGDPLVIILKGFGTSVQTFVRSPCLTGEV